MAEHKDPAEIAKRRALRCLENIETDCQIIRKRVTQTGGGAPPDGADARGMAGQVNELTEYLTVLEALRGE